MFKFNSVMPTLHIIMKTRICEWDFFVQNEYACVSVCVRARVHVSFMNMSEYIFLSLFSWVYKLELI